MNDPAKQLVLTGRFAFETIRLTRCAASAGRRTPPPAARAATRRYPARPSDRESRPSLERVALPPKRGLSRPRAAASEGALPMYRLCLTQWPSAQSPRAGGWGHSGGCEVSDSEAEAAAGWEAESASAVGTQCAVSTRGDGFASRSVKAVRGTVTKSWQSERPHSQRSNKVSASPAPPNATSLMKRCLA